MRPSAASSPAPTPPQTISFDSPTSESPRTSPYSSSSSPHPNGGGASWSGAGMLLVHVQTGSSDRSRGGGDLAPSGRAPGLAVRARVPAAAACSSSELLLATESARPSAGSAEYAWNRELWFPVRDAAALDGGAAVLLELVSGKSLLSAGRVEARGAVAARGVDLPSGTRACAALVWTGDRVPAGRAPFQLALALRFVPLGADGGPGAGAGALTAASSPARAGFHRKNKFRCIARRGLVRAGDSAEFDVEYAPRHAKTVPSLKISVHGVIEGEIVDAQDGHRVVVSVVVLDHREVIDAARAAAEPCEGLRATPRGEISLAGGSYCFPAVAVVPALAPPGPFDVGGLALRYEAHAVLGRRKAVSVPFAVSLPPASADARPESLSVTTAAGAEVCVSQLPAALLFALGGDALSLSLTVLAGSLQVDAVALELVARVCAMPVTGSAAVAHREDTVARAEFARTFPVRAGSSEVLLGSLPLPLSVPSIARAPELEVVHELVLTVTEAATAPPTVRSLSVRAVLAHAGVGDQPVLSVPGIRPWRVNNP